LANHKDRSGKAATELFATDEHGLTRMLSRAERPSSRRLSLLHAHGRIAKVSHTYRWQVTAKERRILTALLAARQADTDKLISLAA
jgi:hypothetical protein